MTQGDAERNYIRLIRLSFCQEYNEPDGQDLRGSSVPIAPTSSLTSW